MIDNNKADEMITLYFAHAALDLFCPLAVYSRN